MTVCELRQPYCGCMSCFDSTSVGIDNTQRRDQATAAHLQLHGSCTCASTMCGQSLHVRQATAD